LGVLGPISFSFPWEFSTPFVSSIHTRASHAHPHRSGIHLTSFLPPEPLLHAGLRLSITAVRPPPFGERPSELLFPSIDRRLLTPGSPSSCRTQPPSLTTTGATPPPLNTAARRRLRRLTVDPPFRCAPALSSLPGATPGPHRCSPTTPCHRRARHRTGTRAAHARCSGPRRPFASLGWAARPWPSRLVGRPRVAGRRAPWAVASGQFRPSTVRWFLNVFQSI
jgi:hypothetical protein